jgi:hypothetical protein
MKVTIIAENGLSKVIVEEEDVKVEETFAFDKPFTPIAELLKAQGVNDESLLDEVKDTLDSGFFLSELARLCEY